MSEDAERARVLIVDDNVDDCEMYRQFLVARGYVVSVAFDGEEAVTRALNGRFDIVVLDLALPKLDGIQVLTLLRSYTSTSRLPVVTLSARTGEAVRAAALDAGADLALEKPLPPEDLESAIRVFVERGKRIRNK
jgi:DNA-binding response OmpR family regulator